MTKKYWECCECKVKYRSYSSYDENIGISSGEKKTCIKCYNKGGENEQKKN